MLPFIYTHLVSLSCTIYLLASAFVAGIEFQPDSTMLFGFGMPAASVLLNTFTIFGLLEVGDTILEPFGSDSEDFAVLHFVDYVATATKEAATVWGVKDTFEVPSTPSTSAAEVSAKVIGFTRKLRGNATKEPVQRSATEQRGHALIDRPAERREGQMPSSSSGATREIEEHLLGTRGGRTQSSGQSRRAATGSRNRRGELAEESSQAIRSPSRTLSRSGLKGVHPGRSRPASAPIPSVNDGVTSA